MAMSLADLLPAVRALSRAEKAELLRAVTDELARDDALWWFKPGEVYSAGSGLHDAHEAAAILWNQLQERNGQK
jgi:hypothetical protein